MRLRTLRLGGIAVIASLALSLLPVSAAAGATAALAASVLAPNPFLPWLPPPAPWQPPGGGNPGGPWQPPLSPWLPPGGGDPPPANPPGGNPPGAQPGHFTDGFPREFQVPESNETGRPVGGWGCDSTGRTDGGAVQHVPVLFVHGSTRDAHDWDQVRQHFLDHGYSLCETWALSYGYSDPQHSDTDDASAPTVQAFVGNMLAYLQKYKNARVTQVDVVTHSLGGTVVRKWLKDSGDYGKVHSFVEIAGPNHGLGICPGGPADVCRELTPGSQWLSELNGNDETPADIRYMTIYDGTGQYDMFYRGQLKDSPALKGATNHPYNVEHRTRLDHVGLIASTAELQLQWVKDDLVS